MIEFANCLLIASDEPATHWAHKKERRSRITIGVHEIVRNLSLLTEEQQTRYP